MSIFSYEQASLFGALDSDIFGDGAALHAHLLRTMAMTGNRLTLKGQHLLTLPWATGGAQVNNFRGLAFPSWTKILGPVPVFKKHWLNTATIKIDMTADTDAVIQLGVGTLAAPFTGPNTGTIVEFTGLGSTQLIDITDVPLLEGTQELVEFWLLGANTTGLADTGTYGTPNTGVFESLGEYYMFDEDAAWNMSTVTNNLGVGGALLSLEDAGNNRVVPFRKIVSVGAQGGVAALTTNLQFDPYLTKSEIETAYGSGRYYSIYKVAGWYIASIAMAADGRTV